jgi:hypothetical protein
MRPLRPALALCLALLLAVTSVSLAVARGQAPPAGEIVICTGLGLQSVAVDAQGRPVSRPHICPDGVAAIAALALPFPALELLAPERRAVLRLRRGLVCEGRDAPPVRSRGPPDPAA